MRLPSRWRTPARRSSIPLSRTTCCATTCSRVSPAPPWRPPDDVFYTELQTRYRRVRLFLPTLLHQVHFEAAPAGAAVVAALEYLKRREAPARAQDVAPSAVVTDSLAAIRVHGRSPGLHLLRPRPTARGAAPAGCLRDAELAVCRSAAQSPGWRRVGGGAADHVSNAWLQSSPRTDPCRVKRRAGSDLPRGGRAPPQQSSRAFRTS